MKSRPSRSNLTKAEAEDLIDWLEAQDFQRQVRFPEGGECFTIRWQQETPAVKDQSRCRRSYREPCPECGSTSPPVVAREKTPLSLVLFAGGLLLWPLLVVGLRLRREVWRCWDCRRVVGRGRLTWTE
jgi:hypothetical protein